MSVRLRRREKNVDPEKITKGQEKKLKRKMKNAEANSEDSP
jgi:hypothetical protein